MGDVADMMLDGTLCEGCGVYLGDSVGYPRRCKHCQKYQRTDAARTVHHIHHREQKIACPTCGKRVKIVGLSDHIRDAHKNRITEAERANADDGYMSEADEQSWGRL